MPPVPVGGGRIGNGVRIPDRTAAVLPSEAQDAIGSNPRRPRDAMKLSQKTCLRSAYQIFGLKRDMFLSCARCGCSRGRRLRYCIDCGIYRNWPVYPAFMSVHSGKTCVFRCSAHWSPNAPTPAGTRLPCARGSRLPTGSAVPAGPRPSRPTPLGAGPASASPGTGV